MHRVSTGVILLALMVSSLGAQTPKKQTTIFGEVIDVVSYVSSGMKPDNADRKAVAEANIRAGNPLGILERKTGTIYIVAMAQAGTSAAETLRPYFGYRVFAQGRIFRKGGLQLFLLSDIGKSVK